MLLWVYEDEKFFFVIFWCGSCFNVFYFLEGLIIELVEEEDFEFIEDFMGKFDVVVIDDVDEELGNDLYELDEFEEEEDDVIVGNSIVDVGSGWVRIVRIFIWWGCWIILDLCVVIERDGFWGEVICIICLWKGNVVLLYL